MGFFDSFSELVAAAMPWETVQAEAPEAEDEEKNEAGEVCVLFSSVPCFADAGW
jgi:hypothetical protein